MCLSDDLCDRCCHGLPFIQVLIRIAVHRYIKPLKAGSRPIHTDVSEAVRELVTEQMLPRLDPAATQDSNLFRKSFVYLEETSAELANHHETMAVRQMCRACAHGGGA